MKLKTILVAAVMILGLSAAAYAQATFSVGSIPVTTVTNTGQTERTGDVTFTIISGSTLTGTITIKYGPPITVPFANIIVTGANGLGAAIGNEAASDLEGGLFVVNVPNGVSITDPLNPPTITVSGVRVAIAGSGLTSLSAKISSTGNAITAGQTSVEVISATADGIGRVGNKTDDGAVEGSLRAVDGGGKVNPTIAVKEGYLAAWFTKSLTEADNGNQLVKDPVTGNTTGVGLRFTLDKAPPQYVSVTFPATVASNGNVWVTAEDDGTTSAQDVTFDSTDTAPLYVYYKVYTGTNPTLTEILNITPTLTVSSSAKYPLAATVVSYTVSLAPIGDAFKSNGDVYNYPIPRYAAKEAGPAVLFSIIGSSTAMIVPYAVAADPYNTGFSIANTTTDPGTASMGGISTAVKQAGTIKFWMYPQLPTPGGTLPASFSYETKAGSPGTGLDSSGYVPSGSTYTVLLSQILSAAGAPAGFQGYIIITANFSNAHCLYVVSNFTTFSQGAMALVLTQSRKTTPEALNN